MGTGALSPPSSGNCATPVSCWNTASGSNALNSNSVGTGNSAAGANALRANTTGSWNTAAGFNALYSNTGGSFNAAFGLAALKDNTGSDNTAFGVDAMYYNTTGENNTAAGLQALLGISTGATGSNNTGVGAAALGSYSTGNNNTAAGYQALYKDKAGGQNTAFGANALFSVNTSFNTGVGYESLYKDTSGKYNAALGWEAGYALTTGSYNIDIGNPGESTDGVAADSGVIRIGTQTPTALQTNTYIAGIYTNTTVSGLGVVVDDDGQLGVVGSSERFKTAIAPMGSNTDKLSRLRPVSFTLKSDAKATRRYGLIAEEVAEVYPELVVRDAKGRIDGIRYDELAPLLLNEAQQQATEIRDLKQEVEVLKALNQRTQVELRNLQIKHELVDQR